eukprot:TRINITY_DN8145_c0_g1_i1.p1 TRINITY_DN8145_c0_g1~~TRINITY_DN8145_c0_g1_i1.p1  ORF type:complete len:230 (-),score=68.57 TRINITY_DN8145_c0_g1_i1:7-696(-)
MNQQYFNGIGNYLRAEILHKAKVAPFVDARSVLAEEVRFLMPEEKRSSNPAGDGVNHHIIKLCHDVCSEVIAFEDRKRFKGWLKAYKRGESMVDMQGRRIWYHGDNVGPLTPDYRRSLKKKRQSKKANASESSSEESSSESDEEIKKPKKKVVKKPTKQAGKRKKDDASDSESDSPSDSESASRSMESDEEKKPSPKKASPKKPLPKKASPAKKSTRIRSLDESESEID